MLSDSFRSHVLSRHFIRRGQGPHAWAHLVIAVEPEGDPSHLSGGHLPGGYGRHGVPLPHSAISLRETPRIRPSTGDVALLDGFAETPPA